MPPLFTAVHRFDPQHDNWEKYIVWSGLTQLRELITLDGILCPSVVDELEDEDWQYNVHEDFKTHLFYDPDYLLHRIEKQTQVNVLAVVHKPKPIEMDAFQDPRFVFRGFDLIDKEGGISALVNCGGFDNAFTKTDLSEYGLLTDYEKAVKVQNTLRVEYPAEPHAHCDLWAIWQMVGEVP